MPKSDDKRFTRPRGRPPKYLGKWNPKTGKYAKEENAPSKISKLNLSILEKQAWKKGKNGKKGKNTRRTIRGLRKDRTQKTKPTRVLDPKKKADLLKILHMPNVFRRYDVKGIDNGTRTKKQITKARTKVAQAKKAAQNVRRSTRSRLPRNFFKP